MNRPPNIALAPVLMTDNGTILKKPASRSRWRETKTAEATRPIVIVQTITVR
jgi:hypothetical protein